MAQRTPSSPFLQTPSIIISAYTSSSGGNQYPEEIHVLLMYSMYDIITIILFILSSLVDLVDCVKSIILWLENHNHFSNMFTPIHP